VSREELYNDDIFDNIRALKDSLIKSGFRVLESDMKQTGQDTVLQVLAVHNHIPGKPSKSVTIKDYPYPGYSYTYPQD